MANYTRNMQASFVAMLFCATSGAFAQTAPADSGDASSGLNAGTTAKAVKATDRKLAHRVATALARTRGLDSARIFVKAREGRITLTGSVTDVGQVSLAEDAAKRIDGVKAVDNDVRVAGPSL